MSEDVQNTNEGQDEGQDPNQDQNPQDQEPIASTPGDTPMVANVDVPYKTGDTDDDGNEVWGYARGGESFTVSEDDAEELAYQNKAYFAKENDEGNYVVDEEKNSEFQNTVAVEKDRQASEESQQFAEGQRARWMNSAVGMLGRDAAESNAMPGDAEELTGRYVDAGNYNREQELHEQAGVTRQV